MIQSSLLLALPGEIRNYIVDFAFERESGTAPLPLQRSPLALPSTCRQLYEEYSSLARSATIFSIPWSTSTELCNKASVLPPDIASSIKRLQVQLPSELTGLYKPSRRRVLKFDFARAGLTWLEELYFRCRPEHHELGVGGPGRELIVQILWRILWERGIDNLKKICIVHDGTQPFLSLTLLYGMLETYSPLRHSKRWEVKSDMQRGQLRFVEYGPSGTVLREIAVIVGYSFREAEEYLAVCGQILEEKHAEVVIARRAECEYVTPLQDMTDEALRREVDNLHTLFPVFVEDERPRLQPHVYAIRAMSSCS